MSNNIICKSNIITPEVIAAILNAPEVIASKKKIDRKQGLNSAEYFTIPSTREIQQILLEAFNLDFSAGATIPLRWIKGDTPAHTDKGPTKFQNTYLAYLTDSPGKLIIANQEFPIQSGAAYIFQEGETHETHGTGDIPRLMLGPMSESGYAVGMGGMTLKYPGGTIIYIRENSGDIQYSTLPDSGFNNINFPCTIENNNLSLGFVKVYFTTSITFNINLSPPIQYFICGSDKIQFGSESLNTDGTRPIITIDGITDYQGLIANGGMGPGNNYNYIYIYNLEVHAINGATLAQGGGWIGQVNYAKGVTNNYIINCHSDGDLTNDLCGGIVGASCSWGGSLNIIGCSSSGNIGYDASTDICGGIAGDNLGVYGGTVLIKGSWSTGIIIGKNSGGITGKYPGLNAGTVTIINCYSSGDITGNYSGGITGKSPGQNGTCIISNCYSIGDITGENSGGICGGLDTSAPDSLNCTITNCYSIGAINGSGNSGGISGAITGDGDIRMSITNCYTTGSTTGGTGYIVGNNTNENFAGFISAANCYSEAFHSSSGWNYLNADSILNGIPPSSPGSGTVWSVLVNGQPYILTNMGYTPYTITNIASNDLVASQTATITAGTATNQAIQSGKSYTILQISGGNPGSYSTITIDPSNGAISTTTSTIASTYTLTIYNTGSYNITSYALTVASPPSRYVPCLTADTTVLTPDGYVPVQYLTRGNTIITSDSRQCEIKEVYHTLVEADINTYPCIIAKDSIAPNYPASEFTISRYHLIQCGKQWICPNLYFPYDKSAKYIDYYHIKLDNYITDHLVINDGVVVESLGFYLSEEENLKEENKEEYVANTTEYLTRLKTLEDMAS